MDIGITGDCGDGLADFGFAQGVGRGCGATDSDAVSLPLIADDAQAIRIGQGMAGGQDLVLGRRAADRDIAGGSIVDWRYCDRRIYRVAIQSGIVAGNGSLDRKAADAIEIGRWREFQPGVALGECDERTVGDLRRPVVFVQRTVADAGDLKVCHLVPIFDVARNDQCAGRLRILVGRCICYRWCIGNRADAGRNYYSRGAESRASAKGRHIDLHTTCDRGRVVDQSHSEIVR